MSAHLRVHGPRLHLVPEYPLRTREVAALLRIQPSVADKLVARYPLADTAQDVVAEFRREARATYGDVARVSHTVKELHRAGMSVA